MLQNRILTKLLSDCYKIDLNTTSRIVDFWADGTVWYSGVSTISDYNVLLSSFIYDRTSTIILMDVGFGHHRMLMSMFEVFRRGSFTPKNPYGWDDTEKLADSFILGGHGVFRSNTNCTNITYGCKFLPMSIDESRMFAHLSAFVL